LRILHSSARAAGIARIAPVRSRPPQGAKRAAAPDENTGQTQQETAATGQRKKGRWTGVGIAALRRAKVSATGWICARNKNTKCTRGREAGKFGAENDSVRRFPVAFPGVF
jgi:hypothetical protein